jgi:hypothetical protein
MGLGAESCAGVRLWSFSRLQEGRPILKTRPNAMARCAPMSLRSRGWIATFLLRFHLRFEPYTSPVCPWIAVA